MLFFGRIGVVVREMFGIFLEWVIRIVLFIIRCIVLLGVSGVMCIRFRVYLWFVVWKVIKLISLFFFYVRKVC